MDDAREAQKRIAAARAVEEVSAGMLVGIGTGTTAAYLIDLLGDRVRNGLTITAVATSIASEAHARARGIRLIDMGDVATVDLCIDGVDEIDGALRAIKGGGGAMLREKIVARAASRMIAIADAGKRVAQLGRGPVPIEVLPFACAAVSAAVKTLGGTPKLRSTRSDQGNALIDCEFGPIVAPAQLATELSAIPGMLGHGLFIGEIDMLCVGTDHGAVISTG